MVQAEMFVSPDLPSDAKLLPKELLEDYRSLFFSKFVTQHLRARKTFARNCVKFAIFAEFKF